MSNLLKKPVPGDIIKQLHIDIAHQGANYGKNGIGQKFHRLRNQPVPEKIRQLRPKYWSKMEEATMEETMQGRMASNSNSVSR